MLEETRKKVMQIFEVKELQMEKTACVTALRQQQTMCLRRRTI